MARRVRERLCRRLYRFRGFSHHLRRVSDRLWGGTDAFVSKLNPAGSALVYSTYLGGSTGDFGYGVASDASGGAYVTGYTTSSNFPTTPGAFQTIPGGGLMCLSAS
jgi:hypothetical protein